MNIFERARTRASSGRRPDHNEFPRRLVDDLFRVFPVGKGFEPASFMFSAEPDEPAGRLKLPLTRSFHTHRDGSCAIVHVHAPPVSKPLRGLLRRLLVAGYETTWRLDDESGARRWLTRRTMVAAELRFLSRLDDEATSIPWPQRSREHSVVKRRPTRSTASSPETRRPRASCR